MLIYEITKVQVIHADVAEVCGFVTKNKDQMI